MRNAQREGLLAEDQSLSNPSTMPVMSPYRGFRPTYRFQSTLALSPDGAYVAYSDDSTGQFNLTVQQVHGGAARRLTSYSDQTVRRVVWHPSGKMLYYQADAKGSGNTQLYRLGLGSEAPEALTDDPAAMFTLALGGPFSADGQKLAYVGNDRMPGDQDVVARDVDTGAVQRVYTGGGRVYAGHWSPDGTRLSIAQWRDGYDHVAHVVHLDGAPAKRLTSDTNVAAYWLGPWLPEGSRFLVRSNAGREFLGLAIMDADSGDLSWLDTPEWDVEAAAISSDGRVAVWVVNVDGAAQLRARDLTTGATITVPALPLAKVEALSISADGRLAVMLLSAPERPWNVVVVELDNGNLRWLTDAAPISVDLRTLVRPEIVRYSNDSGQHISAYLYKPAVGRKPMGAVLSIHGGPSYQERPEYDDLYQYLVSRGVAVLAPNGRGSSGYGRAFEKAVFRDWGGCDLEDLAASARFLQDQDWIDHSRIALYGGSYGGFLALSCAARLPEFDWAAGVAVCGPSNLVTLALATPPAFRKLVIDVIGDPETEADSLLARSPITYVDQIRTPLFIIQGANDPRVPRSESDQLVERLRARGVDVKYDVYPDEGHGFTKTENQTRARADTAEFLLTHVATTKG